MDDSTMELLKAIGLRADEMLAAMGDAGFTELKPNDGIAMLMLGARVLSFFGMDLKAAQGWVEICFEAQQKKSQAK